MIPIRNAFVERWTMALGVGTFFFAGWFGVPSLVSPERCRDLTTHWDALVPYVPQAYPFYLLGYVFPLTPLLAVRDSALFSYGARIFVLLMGSCFAAFFVFPVCLDPPDLGLPLHLQEYFVAVSSNCFPSLHVASAWFVGLFYIDLGHPWKWAGAALAVAITVSTVLLKVHYLWDVAAGVALGAGFHFAFMRERTRGAKGS